MLYQNLKLSKNCVKKWIVLYKGRRYYCCRCERAPKPEGLKGIPKYGHNIAVWSINQNINYRIPISVVSKTLLESFNVNVTPSSLRYLRSKVSEKYNCVYAEIKKNVLGAPFIHIDETSVKVKGFSSPYVWVLTNMDTVIYLFRPNREAGFLKDMLKDFKGVLISDFYPGYESLPCPQQKCLIHLMRDLNEDLLKNQLNIEYKEIVTQFGEVLNTIVKTIEMYGLKKRHLYKHKKDVDKFYKKISKKEYESELAINCRKRFLKNKTFSITEIKIIYFKSRNWIPYKEMK